MPLTEEQKERIAEFAKRPVLAILSTIYPSGAPQTVAVWYDFDGENFIATSGKNRVKVSNILRDSRVTLCLIDTTTQGPQFVIRGTAEIIDDGAQEATRRLAIRYLGEETGRQRGDAMTQQERIIIKITPERML